MHPYAMFDYMGAISFAQWCCPCGQCHHQKAFKTITWLPLSRLPGNKPHRNSPEPSELCLPNLSMHRNSLEPSGTCLRNLPPQLASGTYTSQDRNSPEPSSEPAPATRTSTHWSLSGLKTPLAYAVGEKNLVFPEATGEKKTGGLQRHKLVFTTCCS